MKQPLLVFNESGVYCPKAKVYLDPWRPVDRAIITHGHADHARPGHKHYLTHKRNAPIIQHRLNVTGVETKEWGEKFNINGVEFTLFPAGHIIGSSQVRVAYKDEIWVFTGDYKTESDGLSQTFEPIKCHTLITECTFGLPAFKWRPQREIVEEINQWWRQNKEAGINSVIFAYSLGKAQRVLKSIDPAQGSIFTHGAVENMTAVLRQLKDFPATNLITKDTTKEQLKGSIIIAPPSAHGSTWMRKLVPYATAAVSGWMTFRGTRRRRAIDKGFVLSDHCDWNGLLETVKATDATRVITTHGYQDIFSRYLRERGYDATTEHTQYVTDADEEENSTA